MGPRQIHIYQYANNPVCSPYRFEFPGDLLNKGSNIRVTRFTKFDSKTLNSILKDGDMLFVQRLPMSPVAEKVFKEVNHRGKLVIFEIDDDLLRLPPNSRFAEEANDNYELRIKSSVFASQAVQCSTPQLAEVVAAIHPEVVVLENQLDKVPPFIEKKPNATSVIIGYAAGEDHRLDWQIVKDQYNEVISELASSGHDIETWIIGDKVIFESITTSHKKYFPFLPRAAYLEVLKNFDISLIPLADNAFNRCKSDVKFLESAACSAAVLASTVVFKNSIRHSETGFLFDTGEKFGTHLRRLIINPLLRRKVARKAHQYVSQNRLIEHHIHRWERTYRRWHSLRKELLRHTPKLRLDQQCLP
jgi:glycosyltransferase involved in cell wall biosynthesis